MRNALVIAAREFEEKRFVAYAAIAFAVLPFVILNLIPMSKGKSPGEAIVILAVILSSGFTVGLGVITGATFIGDVSAGRMSFYFSRPVGSLSIWFGKLTAGIVLIVGCFGIIAAPARFIGNSWASVWDITFAQLSVAVLGAAVALFLIAHVIGTFVRSRSPLIAADFVAAVVCGAVIWLLSLPLALGLAANLVKWLLIPLAIALTIAIVAGGAWQLERGRTDRRRGHLALSHFLWGAMAVALLLAAGFVWWVVSVKPADITDAVVSHSPGTAFMTIAGKTSNRGDYVAAWLMNIDDGRSIRIDAQSARGAVQYTRDGRSALWPVLVGNVAELRLYTVGDAAPIDTGLTVWGDFIFPSDDGGRIATVNQGILSIYDVATRRSFASTRIPQTKFARGLFVTPDLFRIYLQIDSELRIFELDVRTRALRETGVISSPKYAFLSLEPTAARMVVRVAQSNVVTLNDARTGTVIRTLLTGSRASVSRCLRDGRIVVIETQPGGTVMHLFAPDGSPVRDIALGPSAPAWFAGDDGTHVVLLTAMSGTRNLVSIDVNRGVVERREPNVGQWTQGGFYELRPAIGPLREVVYQDMQKHVMAWNPTTGASRRIVGG
ncbi:MAG TPA: WD40 repeat domain-containing protein [Thermoanaerobaculia bacterium]|nr:WD40 repeat domain-containing protein [Thermoanaerobaculia bacterium]